MPLTDFLVRVNVTDLGSVPSKYAAAQIVSVTGDGQAATIKLRGFRLDVPVEYISSQLFTPEEQQAAALELKKSKNGGESLIRDLPANVANEMVKTRTVPKQPCQHSTNMEESSDADAAPVLDGGKLATGVRGKAAAPIVHMYRVQ